MLVGFTAVILIILGVIFISFKQKKPEPGFTPEKVIRPKVKIPLIILIFAIGTIGYLLYFVLGELPTRIDTIPDIYNHMFPQQIAGVASTEDLNIYCGFSQFFPQATAMFSMTCCFAMFL
jgi:glucose uptake protein GlcU